MGSRLFVGNLSFKVSSESLKETFSKIGTVKDSKVVTDRETGQSRGFGFVEMSTPAEAASAIETLNNSMLDGRTINVNEAEERKPRPAGGGGGGGYRSNNSGDRNDRGGGGGGGGRRERY